MKKSVLAILIISLFSSMNATAQKFAFIDTEYILSKIDEYQLNQHKIEEKAQSYQLEVKKVSEEVETMYKNFQEKAETMNDKQIQSMQEKIMKKEQEAMELGRKYFGPEGAIADMKSKLLTPFFDKIYEASKVIALKYDYAAIIDRATANSVIFAQPEYDISNEILATMGYSK